MTLLSVNAGSSSLKFAAFALEGDTVGEALLSGQFDGLDRPDALRLRWRSGDAVFETLLQASAGQGHARSIDALDELLSRARLGAGLQAVAHRVVHGGDRWRAPTRIDADVLDALRALCPLAPLHQTHNLAGIEAFMRSYPGLPQFACFDTAFHASLPEEETRFALPADPALSGVRRYGFHGLSYEFVQRALEGFTPRARGRVVMAHLGSGASLCATWQGRSQATTMGFSALDGLMMGTRSGAIDAGVLLHLLQQGWDAARIEDLLYRRSGLLGASGESSDMRQLRASARPEARRAIRLFTHRVVREAGAMVACIGGLDVLAFTGGIGEHDADLRAEVCEHLGYLGVRLDAARNARACGDEALRVSAPGSTAEVWVVPTDEGRMAAESVARILTRGA